MKYILKDKNNDECIFCKAAESQDDESHLVVHRGQHVFIILNRYPYTSGHIMVVPFAHENRLQDLSQEIRLEIINKISQSVEVLQSVYHPEGFNIGMNLGKLAGAGVPEHLHVHVVPRWAGDTSFMSVISETRVLPESLSDTFRRVKLAWDDLNNSNFPD